jgi:hypothetical protein
MTVKYKTFEIKNAVKIDHKLDLKKKQYFYFINNKLLSKIRSCSFGFVG